MSPIVKLRDIKQFVSLSAILTRVNVRIWCPMTNRGCVRFVLPISLPDRCVRKASVCLMNISSDFDFDRVTKPEMTRASSTLLKYNAVLLSARRAAFFLHNVYFCHLSHVTKSDIVNLLCKPQRNEILFDEVTRENVGKLRATPHLPFRVDTTWSGIDTIHQPKNVKKQSICASGT